MRGASEQHKQAETAVKPAAGLRRMARLARDFVRNRAANVYITFAIVAPLLLVLVGAGIDYSYAENSKRMLQDATDAATLAVSAAVASNPNATTTTLKTVAQTVLDAITRQRPLMLRLTRRPAGC